MQTFQINISVTAKDKTEFNKKQEAIATLLQKLNTKELEKLADVLVNNSLLTGAAKRFLGL